MRTYKLALIGFGGVNRALAELIQDDPERFAELGFQLNVVAITDLAMGALVVEDGIDLGLPLTLPRGTTFEVLPGGSAVANSEQVIRDSGADIVVEATFTNPIDGEPAASYVRAALETGKSVATTNKGPVALHGPALKQVAEENGVVFAHEGSVLSGTPLLGLARNQFAGLKIRGFEGILNGFVIGRVESGQSLENAIAEAQAEGYAEADPTADIEGSDVQLKVAILANELLGANILPSEVTTTGISGITADHIIAAARQGKRYKLIGSAQRNDDGSVTAKVAPMAVSQDHPLASIPGATNAVTFDTDLLGKVTITGPGAGRMETAFALITDIIEIHQHEKEKVHA